MSLIIALAALPVAALILMLAARVEESMAEEWVVPDLAPAGPWPADPDAVGEPAGL